MVRFIIYLNELNGFMGWWISHHVDVFCGSNYHLRLHGQSLETHTHTQHIGRECRWRVIFNIDEKGRTQAKKRKSQNIIRQKAKDLSAIIRNRFFSWWCCAPRLVDCWKFLTINGLCGGEMKKNSNSLFKQSFHFNDITQIYREIQVAALEWNYARKSSTSEHLASRSQLSKLKALRGKVFHFATFVTTASEKRFLPAFKAHFDKHFD